MTDLGDTASVRAAVAQLESELVARGVQLSGRIVHVCHYLPVVPTLDDDGGRYSTHVPPLSPPKTPDTAVAPLTPAKPTTAAPPSSDKPRWTLAPRAGHSAMISGIRSLTATHEQLIVGWTGDAHAGPLREPVSIDALAAEDRTLLGAALAEYREADGRGLSLVPVWLADDVAHGHYEGYSKQTLWPLFHYLLWQDVASEAAPEDERHWRAYAAANDAYAAATAAALRPGDLVWVHDYHLLLVPRALRARAPEALVGLFVHTPFPSSEVFRCLPRRREVLDGMLGANLVCFQTYSYSRHFASSCIRVCGYESAPGGIDVAGHLASIMHCAVGVDAERVQQDTLSPGIKPKLDALLSLYEGKKIIVGRDKLDAVKGLMQKLRGFEKLLSDYPQWRGQVVLIEVTSPALSDSPRLERQVSELVAHINGEYGSLDFIPVHHYHQAIGKDEFYALLSAADLGLITPLRDGMNTTSMEFVIAQQRSKQSPLVLSEFMGIAGNMREALQINPWDVGGLAAALHRGLLMDRAEKARRQQALFDVVTTHTSATWAAALVKLLLGCAGAENRAHQTPVLDRARLTERYHAAKKRLFLFDYDGTLTPIVKVPSAAVPSPETLAALDKLSADPRNVVYIISGRDGAFLQKHLGHLRALGMSAEHGCFVRAPGAADWTNLAARLDMGWMAEVGAVFDYYTERTTGAHVERKKSSITWHYRGADPEWGTFQAKQCLDLLENNLAPKRPIEVLVGKKNLEVRPLAINKGEIVKRILYANPDADFVFCAGDDKTDEDMFRALLLFPLGATHATLARPVGPSLDGAEGGADANANAEPVELALAPEGLFSTTVGPSSKRTLAGWHVTSAPEVVDAMLGLVGGM